MNRTLFTIITLSSLFVVANATPFTDGFIMGTLVETVFDHDTCKSDRLKRGDLHYIYKTIDTELIPFTPKHEIKCIEIKTFVPITIGEKFLSIVSLALMLSLIGCMSKDMDDDARHYMIGYVIASKLRSRC